jgi:hypothetical protein
MIESEYQQLDVVWTHRHGVYLEVVYLELWIFLPFVTAFAYPRKPNLGKTPSKITRLGNIDANGVRFMFKKKILI